FQGHRQGGNRSFLSRPARQALLPARTQGQSRPPERCRERAGRDRRDEVARLSGDRRCCRSCGFSNAAAFCQLAKKVLENGAVSFTDFAEFNSQAHARGRVPNLALEAQVELGNLEHQPEFSAWLQQISPRNQTAVFGEVLQRSFELIRT